MSAIQRDGAVVKLEELWDTKGGHLWGTEGASVSSQMPSKPVFSLCSPWAPGCLALFGHPSRDLICLFSSPLDSHALHVPGPLSTRPLPRFFTL